jgi:acyl dehydratase
MKERQLVKRPTTVAMFRMSAVMWNAHRVHFDHEYATGVEGLPGVLVPANLLSSYVCELAMTWGGPRTRLLRLDFRPVAPVFAGTGLTVRGRETDRRPAEDEPAAEVAELELWIDSPSDDVRAGVGSTIVVRASAAVLVPAPAAVESIGIVRRDLG